VKWFTHILWGVAALAIFHIDPVTAAVASAVHTAATDMLGHKGLRRSKYHGLISVLAASALAVYFRNPAMLLLGPVHILLDAASPGRLAVSWAYNIIWSLPAALLIARLY
jgi:hypothetical protein